jgi:phage gp46-like protein
MINIDAKFSKPSGYYDLTIGSDGDIEKVNSFDTAILLSVFGSFRRASATEQSDPSKRRGWMGNQFQKVELGSKLWLLYQARLTNKTINDARTYLNQCLSWLVEFEYAKNVSTVVRRNIQTGQMIGDVTILASDGTTNQRSFVLWSNTGS